MCSSGAMYIDEENQQWDVQGWMSREEISKLIQEYAN